jgi:hypothetical protein
MCAELLLAGMKHNETEVKEEYCWAITQAADRSAKVRSSCSVLELGF